MHDWVVSTKDDLDKFKMEFEDYFNMHYSLIYYVYTFFALMVDQRAKNMFLTYWGSTGKWYPYFYDNDTSFGINNEGQLVLDYYHEDTDQLEGANVYNGQNSVLWTNFRQAFADEIQETYQSLRSSGLLTYDKLIDRFITNGSDKWSESIYNEDSDFKYISMLRSDNDATNLPQVRGTGEEHFRYIVENRIDYCDSKWYAADYADDIVSLRIYTPSTWAGVEPNADITATYFSNIYAGCRYKANGTLIQHRVAHDTPITFESPDETFNDTETAVYGAHLLSSLGDLAPLYCGSVNVSNAEKLIELKVGDSTEGYSNPNLKELSVGTNKLLRKVDVRNCPSLTTAIDLSECPSIEEVYATGTAITGVEFPASGCLRIAHLPGTITNLTLKHQLHIEELTFAGYDSIKTVLIEDCPTVNSLDIIGNASNIERVRLTDVDLTCDTCAEMIALADRNLAGIDENGVNIDKMWIDGKCHIKTLTGDEYARIKVLFPYLTITYDTLTSELVFMSEDGETELTRQTIQNGGNGVDPVTAGTIETPTKESTAQYHFAFGGWSLTPGGDVDPNALLKVESYRVVYVAFAKELRSYTVRFYNGTTLLQTVTAFYGTDATYTGATPDSGSEYLEFTGWKPEPTNITGDLDTYAQYYDPRVITDDWTTIAAACEDGTYADKYAVGAYKPVEINYSDGTSETIDFEIIAHDHDEISDDTEAKLTLIQSNANLGLFRPILIEYNNELHLVTGTTHYTFDDNEYVWVEKSTFPYNFSLGTLVVYNDELYALGGNNSITVFYKWNETEWIEAGDLPTTFRNGGAVVYNNEIHYMGASGGAAGNLSHYKWDGTEWTEPSKLPFNGTYKSYVVYNNFICSSYNGKIYTFDGSSWSNNTIAVPSSNINHMLTCLNGQLYAVEYGDATRNEYCYKYDNGEWVTMGGSLSNTTYSNIVVYRNRIYVIGGDSNADAETGITPAHAIYRLENPRASLTFLAKNLLKDSRVFNESMKTYNGVTAWNAGGWKLSDIRAWMNGSLYSCLPEELRNTIKLIIKQSDAGKAGAGDLITTEDIIWIPSLEEVGLDNTNIVHGQGTAYSVFTDNSSRVRYKNSMETNVNYYTRSSNTYYAEHIIGIQQSGAAVPLLHANTYERGILPGFCIGGNGGASDV